MPRPMAAGLQGHSQPQRYVAPLGRCTSRSGGLVQQAAGGRVPYSSHYTSDLELHGRPPSAAILGGDLAEAPPRLGVLVLDGSGHKDAYHE